MKFEVRNTDETDAFAVYASAEKPLADNKRDSAFLAAFSTRATADELAAILNYADQVYQLAKRNTFGVPRPRN
jgi:hypothetical protein